MDEFEKLVEEFFVAFVNALEGKIASFFDRVSQAFSDALERFERNPLAIFGNFILLLSDLIDSVVYFALNVRMTFLTTAIIVLVRRIKFPHWTTTRVCTVQSALKAIPEIAYLYSLNPPQVQIPFLYKVYKRIKWLNKLIDIIKNSRIVEYIQGHYLKRLKIALRLLLMDLYVFVASLTFAGFFLFIFDLTKDKKKMEIVFGILTQDNPEHADEFLGRTRKKQ